MSAGVETGSRGRGKDSQDFEINIASIIDAFTVLITFLLVSASYISIGIMDAGVAAAGVTSNDATPPSINLMVELSTAKKLTVKVTGKSTETSPIEPKDGAVDYPSMAKKIIALKGKWTDLNAVTLVAEPEVAYKDVVKTMEELRRALPVVLLGGF